MPYVPFLRTNDFAKLHFFFLFLSFFFVFFSFFFAVLHLIAVNQCFTNIGLIKNFFVFFFYNMLKCLFNSV